MSLKSFENGPLSTGNNKEKETFDDEENVNEDNEEMLSSAGTFESRNFIIIPSSTP